MLIIVNRSQPLRTVDAYKRHLCAFRQALAADDSHSLTSACFQHSRDEQSLDEGQASSTGVSCEGVPRVSRARSCQNHESALCLRRGLARSPAQRTAFWKAVSKAPKVIVVGLTKPNQLPDASSSHKCKG